MKITLMEAVMANLAAEEVGRQAVPYSLALALMKVKQATAAEAETFAAEERKLVEKFAAKDEDGNIRVAQGRFTFRAPGERGEYEEQHRQLAETPAEIRFYEAAGAGAGHDLRKITGGPIPIHRLPRR